MLNSKKLIVCLVFLLLFFALAGCSGNDGEKDSKEAEKTAAQTDESSEESGKENTVNETKELQFTNVEERMQLKLDDAKYSGDSYDEEKVLQILEKLPEDLTAEEYYYQMLSLIGEDYRSYYKFFNNVDTSFQGASAKPGEAKAPDSVKQKKQVNVSILFDSSGSMGATINGETKMQLAKKAVETFAGGLPESANVSLTVYGHKGTGADSDKKLSCSSIKQIYRLGKYKEKSFEKALDSFSPAGWTPLAGALELAKKNLEEQSGKNAENIIYVVSDGVETCGGNPVKAAKKLNRSDMKAIVNIIGFDVDDKGQHQLKQVAEAGEGKYSTVRTEQELNKFFEKETTELINEWYDWESKNVNKYYDSESERVNELYDMEDNMVNLAYDEETRFKNLTYEMEDRIDIDGFEIREIAEDIAYDLREYARNTAYEYREEIRNKAYKHRENVRDKAYEEREDLRDKE
ncbi:VWA domain-containing protein [Virgibacillus siamensis]|uniref:VWA domain-containing protein n=1 Tax=Virgibacillus siamensis TaxID=480071 RepID=UPI0009875B03|nr:VWA domain-containing protein [Virgibacillus siamensis]